jgi:hypothetical protein
MLHVATDGIDTATGTVGAPLRTVARALELLGTGQGTVILGSGSFGTLKDTKARTAGVVVRGAAGGTSSLERVDLLGTSDMTLTGLTITGPLMVTKAPGDASRGARRIRVLDSDLSAPGLTCLTVRSGAQDVRIEGNHLHGCTYAIAGPGNTGTARSADIGIRNNLIEGIVGDGVQFGDWDDVTIEGNVIRDLDDPADYIHNDAIQFTGNSAGVRVTNNVLAHSEGQLILVQDYWGPIDDVLVANNLLHHSAAIAIQNQMATRARFINNTIWASAIGGLLLRASKRAGGGVATDTVVANNLLQGYAEMEGAAPSVRVANVVPICPKVPLSGVDCGVDPAFVDVAAENFELAASSPVRERGDAVHAPATDLRGRPRGAKPSLGAIE